MLWGSEAADWTANRWGLSPIASRATAHALLFLAPYAVLRAAGWALRRAGRAADLGGLDRAAGAALGLAAGLLLCGAAAAAAAQTAWGKEWVGAGRLARPLAELFQRGLAWATS